MTDKLLGVGGVVVCGGAALFVTRRLLLWLMGERTRVERANWPARASIPDTPA